MFIDADERRSQLIAEEEEKKRAREMQHEEKMFMSFMQQTMSFMIGEQRSPPTIDRGMPYHLPTGPHAPFPHSLFEGTSD